MSREGKIARLEGGREEIESLPSATTEPHAGGSEASAVGSTCLPLRGSLPGASLAPAALVPLLPPRAQILKIHPNLPLTALEI